MKPSLSASALKVLALFTMLLDHMAYYLYLPELLRWVGRLAAPIFLFFVVEGFGRTRNYKKYLLRVYAVAAGMGIINALLRQYAGGLRPDGITPTNGICATFFLLLVILQGLKRMEQRRWDGILLVAGPFVLPLAAGSGAPHRSSQPADHYIAAQPLYLRGRHRIFDDRGTAVFLPAGKKHAADRLCGVLLGAVPYPHPAAERFAGNAAVHLLPVDDGLRGYPAGHV